MNALVQAHDWSATPLGPQEQWPQSLKTTVEILLSSRYSMWLAWGPELTFIYNDRYRHDTLAAKHPWALGTPTRVVWSEIWEPLQPRIRQVIETGESTWDEALLLFPERNGYREESYHTFSYSPLRDDEGSIAGLLCVVAEVTERVLSDRQLGSLRQLAAELNRAITQGEVFRAAEHALAANPKDLPFALLYLLDEDGSTARLVASTGFSAAHPAAPIEISLDDPDAFWPIAQMVEGGQHLRVDLDQTGPNLPCGAWDKPPTAALLAPMRTDKSGRPSGCLITGVNRYRRLTDEYAGYIDLIAGQIGAALTNAAAFEQQKERAEALAQLDRAKTVFFSNVSHELRTPLTLMLAPLEDELANPDAHPEARQRLKLVHRNGMRLLRLVNTLLEFTRVESGRVRAQFVPTDLAAFTRELASTFQSAVERAGLAFQVDCEQLAEPVFVDRDMWERVLLNLLSNALKSTFSGSIGVRLRATPTRAQLQVSDTGTGIPEHEVPHLFERFRRVEGARRRTHEGSGIGLALVQELVRLHGGAISVDTAVDRGTTFTIAIPFGSAHLPPDQVGARVDADSDATSSSARAAAQEALRWLPENTPEPLMLSEEEADEALASAAAEGERPMVLVVDDNRDMRSYVAGLLRGSYRVREADNGRAALESMLQRKPDLVVSDVMMPDVDGFELLQAIRSNDDLRSTAVILLSARAGEESRLEGIEAGADDYLVKPFTARELRARVAAHMAMVMLRRRTAERERELLAETQTERNRLQEILMRAPAGIALLIGPEHRFTVANQRYLEMVGRSAPEEILHKPLLEAIPEIAGQPFPAMLESVLKTGEPATGTEIRVQLARGQHGALEDVFVNFMYQPWRDGAGRVEGVFVHVVEVTDSVRARHAVEQLAGSLQEREGRLRAILEQVVSGICQVDANGCFMFANERFTEMCGRSLADLKHAAIFDVSHPADEARMREVFGDVMRHGRTHELVQRYLRPDGSSIWIQGNFSAVLDEAGVPRSAVCVVQDITERKRAEEALRRNEKLAAVGQLASTIAHEINNPLEAVTNLLYLVGTSTEIEQAVEYADLASNELMRVSHVVTSTLGFHREAQLRMDRDVTELLESTIFMYQSRMQAAGVELRRDYRPPLMLTCYPAELRQVFANLVGNAFDASRVYGRKLIRLRARPTTDWVAGGSRGISVTIADAGTGISPEIQRQIFQPFFTTKGIHGSGLGLWLSLEILKKHGARVRVRSSQRDGGSGTVFSIFFPEKGVSAHG